MTAYTDMPFTPFSRRAGLGRTLLTSFLVSLIIWQPLWLHATEVTPADQHTQVVTAPSGTTVVNIATPNGNGLSHNRYGTFNVSERGVILNNSREVVNTNLAGHIFANPNLVPGHASLILNEVVSQNPSSLLGAIEVAGLRADVVLANPNGITCNGCGFLNTSRATLSTGTPLIDGGSLIGFDVRGGTLGFEGAGGNMLGSERFDAIAGAIRLNADLHGHTIEMRAGNQQVAYADLATTANDATLADSGAEFAISSSAVGGIYGDRIRLIANGDGVGVHLDAPVAAQLADVEIRADGAVRFARVSAANDVAIHGQDITAAGAATAGDELDLHAERSLTLAADTSEGRRLNISATTLSVSEQAALTGRAGTLEADTLTNAGTLRVDNLSSDTTHLANSGTIEGRHLTLSSSTLDNSDGTLNASDRLNLTVDRYDHRGEVQADRLTLTSASDIHIDAEQRWQLAGSAELNAEQVTNEGVLTTVDNLHINAQSMDNHGDIATQSDLHIAADRLTNHAQSLLLTANSSHLSVDTLINEGDIYALTDILIEGLSTERTDRLINRSGSMITQNGNITLNVEHLTNERSGELVFVPEWQIDQVVFPDEREGRDSSWHERCFNNNKASGCKPSAFRDTLRQEIIPEAQLEAVAREAVILSGNELTFDGHRLVNDASVLVSQGAMTLTTHDRVDAQGNTIKGEILNQALRMDLDHQVVTDRSWFRKGSRQSSLKKARYIYTTIDAAEAPEFCAQKRVRCERAGRETSSNLVSTEILRAVMGSLGDDFSASTAVLGNGEHGANVSFANAQDVLSQGQILEDDSLFRLNPLAIGGMALPGRNGLFISAPPGSGFLFETNPLLTQETDFLGSRYMLDHLGWNPNGNQILLGDNFYELNLLQNALLGQPQLAGASQQQREQFFNQLLVDGVAAAESLELAVGVALSAEQINALQSDIIWLEEKQIAGQTVLVPVVYLAQGALAINTSQMIGSNIDIDAEVIVNDGIIQAQQDLSLTSTDDSVLNSGVLIAGDGLTIDSAADLDNTGGHISGNDVEITVVGNVINDTAVEQIDSGTHIVTAISDQGTIDANGTLTINAGGNVFVNGGVVSAEQAYVQAGGDIIVDTVTIQRAINLGTQSNTRLNNVGQLTSDITSLLDTLLEAEGNIRLAGANLTAGGNASLLAGGDITIEAAAEEFYHYSKYKDKGSFGKSKTTILEMEEHTLVGSELNVGGNLTLNAGNDLTVSASTAHADGDVTVDAGGTVSVISGVESDFERNLIIKKNAARIKTTDSGHYNETLAEAAITSGGHLSIDGQHVALGAARLGALGDLNIGDAQIATDAKGQMLTDDAGRPVLDYGRIDSIDIGTVTLNSEEWHTTTSSLRGPLKTLATIASVAGMAILVGPQMQLLGGGNPEITTGKSSSQRTETSREVGSNLAGENILLSANDNITLTGATVTADETSGRVVALANEILLDTAVTDTTEIRSRQKETVSGIGPSLQKDAVSVGGVRLTDHTETTTTNTVTHQGTWISGNEIVLQAEQALTLINADVHATGEDGSLTLAADTVEVTGVQDTETVTHTELTKVKEITAAVRNAYVDAGYAVKAAKDAAQAVKDAERALSDGKRRVAEGTMSESTLKDLKANLAIASANLVQADLAAAQALAASATAAVSGGTGFYASAQAQVTETRSESTDRQANWQGSQLSGATINIEADLAKLVGSDVAANTLNLMASQIELLAGENTQSNHYEQETRSATASLSSSGSGSWNAGIGYNKASGDSEATQYVNTHLNVGHLNSESDSLTLRGAVITANTAQLDTGTLTVESLQDTARSDNRSVGVNLGIGGGTSSTGKPQSGSAGFNTGKGYSESALVNEQSAILIGNGADSQLTARDTHLIGGMIANATWEIPEDADEHSAPVLVDHGELNFITDTLTVSDIHDYSRSEQSGFGMQLSQSTTSVSLQNEGHRMEVLTQATLGAGNITVGGTRLEDHADFQHLNRDINNAQIVTLDQQTGALNGTVTLDNRLLNKDGRQEIINQQQNILRNSALVIAGGVGDVARVAVVAGSVVDPVNMGDALDRINGSQQLAYEEEGKVAGKLEAIRDGDVNDASYLQEGLGEVDAVLNGDEDDRLRVVEGAIAPNGNAVAGAANVDNNRIYVDIGKENRRDLVNTIIHEGMHLVGANEPLSWLTGIAGQLTYQANAWANSGQINAQRPVYFPAFDAQASQNLLSQNLANFAERAGQGALDYRQLNRHEMAAILTPENQFRYQMTRQALGLPPSDDPGRDLYLAGVASTDAQAAAIVGVDYAATLVIEGLRAESVANGEQYRNDSGSIGALFEVSAADYAAPLVNSMALYNEEQFNGFPIKDSLLTGVNEFGQHTLLSQSYWPAMDEANRISGDAMSDQALMAAGLLALPAAASGSAAVYGFATIQGPFWGGVVSQLGLRGAQSVGASGYVASGEALTALQGVYAQSQSALYGGYVSLGLYNPATQAAVSDFIEGFIVPGTPPPSPPGYAGGFVSTLINIFPDMSDKQDGK